nr:chromate transporter [Butyrivibrio sp.]
MIYLDLLLGFLKVGFFAFGGGYAAVPLIRDVVLSHGWLDDEALTYMIAVAESTPGPIMVNLATYVGSLRAGFPGAAVATVAVVFPSFIIVVLIVNILKSIMNHRYVQALLDGLKPSIVGIILATGVQMLIQNCLLRDSSFSPDVPSIGIALVLAVIYFGSRRFIKKGISPIMLIGIAAVMGVV